MEKITIEEVIKIANVLNLDRKKVDSIFFDNTADNKNKPFKLMFKGFVFVYE